MSIVIIITLITIAIVWVICGYVFFTKSKSDINKGEPIYVGVVATVIISIFGSGFGAMIPVDTEKEQKYSYDKVHTTSNTFIDTGDHYLRSSNLDLRNCEIELFIVKSIDSYGRVIDEELNYKIKECNSEGN